MIIPPLQKRRVWLSFSEDLQFLVVFDREDPQKKEVHRISKCSCVKQIQAMQKPHKGYCFEFGTGSRRLLFEVGDKNELLTWLEAISILVALNRTLG